MELPPPSLTSVSAALHMARSTVAEESGRAEAERSSEASTSARDKPLAAQGVSSAESSAAVQQDSTDANRRASESANEVTIVPPLTPREIAPSVVDHEAFLQLKRQPQTDATVLDLQLQSFGWSAASAQAVVQSFLRQRDLIGRLMSDLILWREEQFVQTGSESDADKWLRIAVLRYAAAGNPPPF